MGRVYEDGEILVDGIPAETTKDSLTDYFQQFGDVSNSSIMVDDIKRQSRVIGLVTFVDSNSVNKVLACSQHCIHGKRVKVKTVYIQPTRGDTIDTDDSLIQSTEAKVKNILIEKVRDWKRFARLTCCCDNVDGIVNQIDHDVKGGDKSKIESFLTKLVELHPNDSVTYIQKSLKAMERNDLLQELVSLNICKALKTHYLTVCKKTEQLVHNMINTIDVELSGKFVELTLVDANEVEKDTVNRSEREYFLRKHLNYEQISLQEVLSKNPPLLLISGIAGIGKTLFLKKCILDWAKGLIWTNVDLVFFLECRQLNLCENIGSIDELLNVFYKNVVKGYSIPSHMSIMFVVDGLDEFFWLNELLNHDSKKLSQYPIVNTLANALNLDKAKCIIAGRLGAMSKYKKKVHYQKDKLIIQIMGFNSDGINDYIKRNTHKNQTEIVKNVLQESYAAKAMASVPFYLAVICAIISSTSEKNYSFNTMTELYCCIFLYLLNKHINKNKEAVWEMMESASVKQYILRVCKIAFDLLKQGKVIFSHSELKQMGNFDDYNDDKVFGFIEKIESQHGYRYQFVHLTLMEFCASVHAYICLTPKKIMKDERTRSLLPMICGLANSDSSCYVNFIAKMKGSRQGEPSLLSNVYNLLLDLGFFDQRMKFDDSGTKMFMECFFEAQGSITDDLKRFNKQNWKIDIGVGKTAREVSHEIYFMEKLVAAGFKLHLLSVRKKILSEDEKKLLILCSNNLSGVNLYQPVKIDGRTLKHKIGDVWIHISRTFVSKTEFECFVLPWIRLAEDLTLHLHEDTNFIDDICEWLRGLNLERLCIKYRKKDFYDTEELKKSLQF